MRIPKEPSRNRSGLTYLRDRYIARAKVLLDDKKLGFLESIRDARSVWAQHHQRWKVEVAPAPDNLALDANLIKEGMLWPEDLWRDHSVSISSGRFSELSIEVHRQVQDASHDWTAIVHHLCHQYWPEKHFINPYVRNHRHAAAGLVSASLLHFSATTVIPYDRVEHLIPKFQIGPEALPYSPHEPLAGHQVARNSGMLAYYQELVERLLKDDPDKLREIWMAALDAGHELEKQLFPDGTMPSDQRKWWWYIPIFPGMSAEDLRRAESDVESIARGLSGDRPIDDMIASLKKEGKTHQAIADLLGIDTSTVKRRLRDLRKE